MKLPAAHAAHMQRRRLHRVSACAARAEGYQSGIAPKLTRLRPSGLRRGSPRHSSLQQAAGYSGEGE